MPIASLRGLVSVISIAIPGLRGIGAVPVLRQTLSRFLAHDMVTHARAVTFQVLFSFFPFVILFMALLGYLEIASLFDYLRRQSEVFFLRQTAPQMNAIIDQLQQRRHGMLSFGIVFALWASSSAMRAMMNAMNVVYGVREERPLWKRYLLSVLATLAVGAALAFAVTLLLVRPAAMAVLAEDLGLPHWWAGMWAWYLRWPAVLLLLTAVVTVIYWITPDVEQRFRFVTPGAVIAVLVWFGASLGFDFYVRNIGSYDRLYGSVGTAVVLLLYFFLTSFILLFGAELNAAIEHLDPAGKNPGDRSVD
ncbi:MAG TPA: YihY/virulence factor BrkB family protein [Noviherbaspirillum sp.]